MLPRKFEWKHMCGFLVRSAKEKKKKHVFTTVKGKSEKFYLCNAHLISSVLAFSSVIDQIN